MKKKPQKKHIVKKSNSNEYIVNFIRDKCFSDKHLVMDDYGNWLFLNGKEYCLLKENRASEDKILLKKLEEKSIVIPKKNSEIALNNLVHKCRKKKNFLFYGPALHIIIATLRCDMKCLYCHASSKPLSSKGYDMDKATAKKTVDMIFKSPSPFITIEFQGGEPLLNFDIIKYITDYTYEKNKTENRNLLITVVSNLNHLDKEKLNYLLKNKIIICTSLDGHEKLHNLNRGSYSRLVSSINMINSEMIKRKIKNQRLNALLTVTKESLKHSKEIIDEYLKRGFIEMHIRSLNNLGNARLKSNNITYSADEFIKFWKECLNYIIKLNLKGTFFIERKTQIILKKIFNEFDPNYTDLRSPCGAVIGQLVYNHDGSVYTCDEGRMVDDDLFKLGTVNQNYKDITTNPTACSIIAASVNDTLYCDKCVYKPLCGICPVINYAESGSIIGHIPSSSWCKIHMAQFDYIFDKLANDPNAKKVFMNWLKNTNIVDY